MTTPLTEQKQTTDHLMTAFSAIRTQLAARGVDVAVRRKNEFTAPVMTTGTGVIVSPSIERGGPRYSNDRHHVLVWRTGYGRGCTHRFKVGPNGSVNAVRLAELMADKIKWNEGEPARQAIAKEQRERADAVRARTIAACDLDTKVGAYVRISAVETAKPEDEAVSFNFSRTVTPAQAVAIMAALRSSGVEIYHRHQH